MIGYQDSIIVISARESNREDENSRKKVQNVVTDSTPVIQRLLPIKLARVGVRKGLYQTYGMTTHKL